VKGTKVGRRAQVNQRFTILLFDDRLEEVSPTFSSLEVRRFFFDEAGGATVQARARWPHVLAWGIVTFFLVSITWALMLDVSSRPAGIFFAVFLAIALVPLGLSIFTAPHLMALHAPDDRLEFDLPRWPPRRERAIRLVLEAVARRQGRPAPAPGPTQAP